jgi:preprotein translocase subunit SecG
MGRIFSFSLEFGREHGILPAFLIINGLHFMSTLLISLLTLVLLLISAFVILIVLMQRTSQSGGMGAALGGGAAESAFGSETNNVLTKGTVYGIIAFFMVALGLYLLYQAQAADVVQDVDINKLITAQEEKPVAETITEVVESVDLEGTSEAAVESVEEVAAEAEAEVEEAVESIDAAVEALPQPATN